MAAAHYGRETPSLNSQARWLIIFLSATRVIEWTIADAGGPDFIESWLIQHYDFPKIFPAISLSIRRASTVTRAAKLLPRHLPTWVTLPLSLANRKVKRKQNGL